MKDIIHIIGAGGVAGIGMTRCLKKDKSLYIQGHDSSEWATIVMECEKEHKPSSMIIPVPDKAVLHYADHAKCYLPSVEEIMLCQDKTRCAEVLGELAPQIYWGRDNQGAGGSGAQLVQEYLPGRNFSCEILYWNGEFIADFEKERLSYDLQGSKEPTHQRGSSAVSKCVAYDSVFVIVLDAMRKLENYTKKKPHGVYSIDLKENRDGELRITEINPGRFLTASYVYFYMSDYNLPLMMVNKYLNKDYKLGKYPEGKSVIRQTDSLPFYGEI